jgi:hypothetical protein
MILRNWEKSVRKKLKPPELTALEKRTVKNLIGLVRVILRQRKVRAA